MAVETRSHSAELDATLARLLPWTLKVCEPRAKPMADACEMRPDGARAVSVEHPVRTGLHHVPNRVEMSVAFF